MKVAYIEIDKKLKDARVQAGFYTRAGCWEGYGFKTNYIELENAKSLLFECYPLGIGVERVFSVSELSLVLYRFTRLWELS